MVQAANQFRQQHHVTEGATPHDERPIAVGSRRLYLHEYSNDLFTRLKRNAGGDSRNFPQRR
jgi:hypothetical protein